MNSGKFLLAPKFRNKHPNTPEKFFHVYFHCAASTNIQLTVAEHALLDHNFYFHR